MNKINMNKIKLFFTFVLIIGVITVGLYYVSYIHNKEKAIKMEHINKGYGYSNGIIVEKKSYKGHSIEVKYKIGGKEYEYTGGWDSNPRGLREGDSVKFRYAIDAPEFIITELEDEY